MFLLFNARNDLTGCSGLKDNPSLSIDNKSLDIFSLKKFLKKYLEIKEQQPVLDASFVSIPCDCGKQVDLEQTIYPGEAAVLNCENCELSWTIYNPPLVVKKTKELPENLQGVWANIAEDNR